MDATKLAQVYQAWGVSPTGAADCAQAGSAPPNVARTLFQVAAWDLLINESTVDGEREWVEAWLRWGRTKGEAHQGVAGAVDRLVKSGTDLKDLSLLVRSMQQEVLYGMCGLLDCEGLGHFDRVAPDHPTSGWRLMEIDEKGEPIARLESLHEGLEDFDPLNPAGLMVRG